ncbi:MAG: Sua5/YciO/YrdC/YwlC family protein [Epsilonproteobacteria bacterium]|nr:Sua5/YciO/YrdC/YwlC family protein [Campylobacterota bacterium]
MDPKQLYLTQTDTTVGFLSQDIQKLADAKQRDNKQPFLIAVDSFKKLKKLTRIPAIHKKRIRRQSKTSFLYQNQKAIRVVKTSFHGSFLKNFDYLYSTSANKHKSSYKRSYAFQKADIVIEDNKGLIEVKASKIFKLGKKRVQQLR